MVEKLKSIGAGTLMQETLPEPKWLIDDLLGPGCYILASVPKMGKSLLCLSLGLAVTRGAPFLGSFNTHGAGVCILAVEDRIARIQDRLWKLADEASDDLRIVERAESLDNGLIDQLADDLADHPGTGVYIIDTYAAVRSQGADFAYQDDYDDLRKFADFADMHGISVIVCHHCRKSVSTESPFLDISGTTGLTGAVAGMWVLHYDPKDSGRILMSVSGKDIELNHYALRLDGCKWEMVEPLTKRDYEALSVHPCVNQVIDFIYDLGGVWSGSAKDLMGSANVVGLRDDVFGKHLARYRTYMARCGVAYERCHTNKGNILTLGLVDPANE